MSTMKSYRRIACLQPLPRKRTAIAPLLAPAGHPCSAREIRNGLRHRLAAHLAVHPAEIADTDCFDELGLDSVVLVGLTGEFERWLGFRIDPRLPFEHATIQALADALVHQASPTDRFPPTVHFGQ
jgi:acyl carrier protein